LFYCLKLKKNFIFWLYKSKKNLNIK
jgi:hypothetical protein